MDLFREVFCTRCCNNFIFRSGSKIVTIGGAAIIATISGSVVLAKTSDGFRKFSEKNIPGTSFLFNLLLGPSISHLPKLEPPAK